MISLLALLTTESYEFHDLIRFCNPNAFIPTGDTIKHDVLKMFKSYQINVQNLLQVSKYLKIKNFLFNLTNLNFLNQKNTPRKISFALDTWTSPNMLSFLGITCHYIDSDWKLKDILVDFVCLEGSHLGENLANSFIQCLQKKNTNKG